MGCDTGMHGCSKKDYDISVMTGICNECWDILGKPEIRFAIKTELIIALTIKNDQSIIEDRNDQSLNEDRNRETNNRKEEKMKENNSRRREQREQREREIRDMERIEIVEVQAMIHREPTRREPQNEIIIENMEIVGDEQTETKKKS